MMWWWCLMSSYGGFMVALAVGWAIDRVRARRDLRAKEQRRIEIARVAQQRQHRMAERALQQQIDEREALRLNVAMRRPWGRA